MTAQVNMDAVKKFIDSLGVTPHQFAMKTQISYAYVYRVLRGKSRPGIGFVLALIDAGMDPREIFTTKNAKREAF